MTSDKKGLAGQAPYKAKKEGNAVPSFKPPPRESEEISSSTPETHQRDDLAHLPEALEPLTEEKRWIVWKWIKRRDKGGKSTWTKPLFLARDPNVHAKVNDPNTWGRYEDAVERVRDRDADGIGYALLNSNVGAVDLDHCCRRDPKTKKVKSHRWALDLRDEVGDAYREVTVSGTGQRIIGRAGGPDLHRRFNLPNLPNGAAVELFRNTPRYITISGLKLGTCTELPPIDEFLDSLRARFDERPKGPPSPQEGQGEASDYDALLRQGVPEPHRSEAFQRWIWHQAARGWTAEQIEAELRRHPTGIAEKYLRPKDRLTGEVERSFAKWRKQATGAVGLDDFSAYMPTHSYVFRPTREMWVGASVNARIPPPAPKTPATTWLDRHRAVEQMTWAPGLPTDIEGRLIAQGGWIERPGCKVLNLYRPPMLVPRAGDVSLWRNHLRRLYGDFADHIEHWLAHRVQRPGEKINHALFLGGDQGIGKDTLLEPVKRAVGSWNCHEVSPKQVLGRFNDFLKSVILRVSEARDLGEVDRFAFYDHMKVVTAAPPDVLRVDEKHLREHYVPNVVGVIYTTNHKTTGIYLPADDRRHAVGWSNATKEEFSAEYWNRFWQGYAEGGDAAVAYYLANLDLSGFNPKAPPPKTAAFWEIVDNARAPEDAEIADALDGLGRPAAIIIDDIKDRASSSFIDWLNERKNLRILPHRLEACGYVRVRNSDADDGYFRISGRRQPVYARQDLTDRERTIAARGRADEPATAKERVTAARKRRYNSERADDEDE